MANIDGMKVDEFTITPRDYPPLKENITLNINKTEPDKEGWFCWIGFNNKYGIRCVTSSRFFKNWKWLAKRFLKEYAIENIDHLTYCYIIEKNDNINQGLRDIINELKKIIDPSKRTGEPWITVENNDEDDGND